MRKIRIIAFLAALLVAVSAVSAVSASRPVRNNGRIAYAIGKVVMGGGFKHGPNMSVYASLKNRKKNPSQVLTDCSGAQVSGRTVPDIAAVRFEPKQVSFEPCRPNKDGGYKPDLDFRSQAIDGNIKLLSPTLQSYYSGKRAESLRLACRLLSASCRHLLAVEAGAGGSYLEYSCLGSRSSHRTHFLIMAGKRGSRRISCSSSTRPPKFMLPVKHAQPPTPVLPVATPTPAPPLPPKMGDVKVVFTIPNVVAAVQGSAVIKFHISCGNGTTVNADYLVTGTTGNTVQKLAECPVGSMVSVEEVVPQYLRVLGENPRKQIMQDSSGILMDFVNQICPNIPNC
jgi:hypothetical protein